MAGDSFCVCQFLMKPSFERVNHILQQKFICSKKTRPLGFPTRCNTNRCTVTEAGLKLEILDYTRRVLALSEQQKQRR